MKRDLYVDGQLHVEFGLLSSKPHNPHVILDGNLALPLELFWHLINDPEVKRETEKRYEAFSRCKTRQ